SRLMRLHLTVFAVLDQPTSMTSAFHWRTFLVVLVFAGQNEVTSSCHLQRRRLVVVVFALLHLPSGTHYLSNCMRQLSADNNSKMDSNPIYSRQLTDRLIPLRTVLRGYLLTYFE